MSLQNTEWKRTGRDSINRHILKISQEEMQNRETEPLSENDYWYFPEIDYVKYYVK